MDVSLGELSAAPPRDAARLEAHPLPARPGVRVVGEVTLDTRRVWREALGLLTRQEGAPLHMELSELAFIDVAGVTDLVTATRSLSEGQHLVVHRPPPQLTRVLDIFWPGTGGIEVAP
ncbi:STAS domain-containing protein [Streptomyces gibsoniae]|uniref:STAS domain-containing protein n=1 Tax=Streptomyces gibsoniae TaxID=3075529 RepID=A0ABU2U061_9ACTN|nr:STAS domain-containing protein [Streptomyces sp. DSM 41699]MDT0466569.1 STAS domain-containing protein [Streptomyces sp. DSM 41699]